MHPEHGGQMKYFWYNRFNGIERDGPFATEQDACSPPM
jgi:hypothetical protein